MMLDPRQVKAIKLLVYTEKTQKEIAKTVGVARSTLYEWRKDDDFRAGLQKELEFSLECVRDEFKKNAGEVHKRLMDIMRDPKAQDKDVIAAGKFLLEMPLGRAASSLELTGEQTISVKSTEEKDILDIFESEIDE